MEWLIRILICVGLAIMGGAAWAIRTNRKMNEDFTGKDRFNGSLLARTACCKCGENYVNFAGDCITCGRFRGDV